ncbi:alpha/beta hydrolase family protein [Actinoplanes sp. G11-F43]|uniref:alpha/beta hydrolase family protein n=1 Tax=Actinoplanes sp. G11-F43 TaxID=3424130 RepID=UPI003D3282B3
MKATTFRSRKLLAAILTSVAAAAAVPTPAVASSPAVHSFATTINGDAADVYYPRAGTRLPVALLLQGANVDKAHYSSYARILASYGFAVAVPNHSRVIFGTAGLFPEGAQAAATVAWAAAQDADPASPLHRRVDEDRLVLAGHSFGAAAALTLSGGTCGIPFCPAPVPVPQQLAAVATYGGNTVNGDAPLPVPGTVPVAYLQGLADGVATPAEGRATYDVTAATPKAFIAVTGANHYGITDVQNPPGAAPDPSTQTLPQRTGVETTARWTAKWFRAQLGDPAARAYIHTVGDRLDPNVTVTSVR